jgi:hypothetical protein
MDDLTINIAPRDVPAKRRFRNPVGCSSSELSPSRGDNFDTEQVIACSGLGSALDRYHNPLAR